MSKPSGSSVLFGLFLSWILGWGTGAVKAFVFMKGWEWFVVDTFDAPPLGFVPAWGLALVVSFATTRLDSDSGDDPLTPAERAVATTFGSLMLSGVFFISMLILSVFA